MRWIPLVILAYAIVLLEGTLLRVAALTGESVGVIGPDLLCIAAVFLALHCRDAADAMLGAWILGMAADLTTVGGPASPTVVGPMSVAFALAGGMVYRMRDAFFREWKTTQAFLAALFCLVAHGIWLTAQLALSRQASWSGYGTMLLQALLIAVYTGLVAPLVYWPLNKAHRWFVGSAGVQTRRGRR